MLTTRAITQKDRSNHDVIMFQLLSGGLMFHEFEYPLMSRNTLKKFIAGQDAQDQNDEGFFIKLKAGLIEIESDPNSDVYEASRYTLPFEICKPTFEKIAELYPKLIKERCERFGEEYHSESEDYDEPLSEEHDLDDTKDTEPIRVSKSKSTEGAIRSGELSHEESGPLEREQIQKDRHSDLQDDEEEQIMVARQHNARAFQSTFSNISMRSGDFPALDEPSGTVSGRAMIDKARRFVEASDGTTSFNADFDGDEVNFRVPQTEKQREHSNAIYMGQIKDAASTFVLNGWYIEEYGGQSYLDFLMHETEERPNIPSYFVAKFNRKHKLDEAMEDLSHLMADVLDDDILLGEYLKDTFSALRETQDEATLKRIEELISSLRARQGDQRRGLGRRHH